MAITTTQNGLTVFIVGTSEATILAKLVELNYPKVISGMYDETGSQYRIIAAYDR